MASPSITVICNCGTTTKDKVALAETIRQAFADKKQEVDIVTPSAGDNFMQLCKERVEKARQIGGIIVAAGGDGTVNSIAGLCCQHQVTLGIIPLGTFNYFAREHGIPTEIAGATEIIAAGQSKKVAVGMVQDRVFLNNASFGLYTKLIRQREEASSRFGRMRIVAVFAAVNSLFSRHSLYTVTISVDGKQHQHKTVMVFAGNNTLQLKNLGMKSADVTKRDQLAIIVMKKVTRFEIARMLLSGMAANLRDNPRLEELSADCFEVTTRKKSIHLVIDGEIITCMTPLKFHIEKDALNLLAPPPEP